MYLLYRPLVLLQVRAPRVLRDVSGHVDGGLHRLRVRGAGGVQLNLPVLQLPVQADQDRGHRGPLPPPPRLHLLQPLLLALPTQPSQPGLVCPTVQF